jgi:hypothetical protein
VAGMAWRGSRKLIEARYNRRELLPLPVAYLAHQAWLGFFLNKKKKKKK